MPKASLRILPVLLPLLFIFCKSANTDLTYSSEDLKLISVSKNSYIHISYLQLSNGSTFPCNGLVYVNDGKAVVFDSPSDPGVAKELISWLSESNELKITAFIVNHFHVDCTGGIEAFHHKGITSYANRKTFDQITDRNKLPRQTFEDKLTLKVGSGSVINRYFGEAHTTDNIVSYIPDEAILFGGCMIKSVDAAKGNLQDANLAEWANTVSKIKKAYPQLKVVIPGHGEAGDAALLDYTIELFSLNP